MISKLVSLLLLLLYCSIPKSNHYSSQNDVFKYKPDHVIAIMMGEESDVPAGHMFQPVVITCKQSWAVCYWGH